MAGKKETTTSNESFFSWEKTGGAIGDLYKLYAYAKSGNKSAEMALRNRFVEGEADDGVEGFIDDENLYKDVVAENIVDIDKELGKMLRHFVAKDARERKKEDELKRASLSRRLLGDFREGHGSLMPGAMGHAGAGLGGAISGGFLPTGGRTEEGGYGGKAEEGGPGGKAPGESFFDKVPSWLKDIGGFLGYDLTKMAGSKGMGRLLKHLPPSAFSKIPGGKGLYQRLFGKNLDRVLAGQKGAAVRWAKTPGIGRAIGGTLPGLAAFASMMYGSNVALSAEATKRRQLAEVTEGIDTNQAEGRLYSFGLQSGLYAQDVLARERGSGVGTMVGGGLALATGFIPVVGPGIAAILGPLFGAAGSKFGEWISGGKFERILSKLGLTREDVDLAIRVAKGESFESIFADPKYSSMTDREKMAMKARIDRAAEVIVSGIGDPNVPETWPIDMAIPDGTSTDAERIASLPIIFRRRLHKAVYTYYGQLVKAISETNGYKNTPDDKKHLYMAQGVAKNRAKLGIGALGSKYASEIESLIGYDRPGEVSAENKSPSPYASGVAIDILPYAALDSNLKELGFRHIKGDPLPYRYFFTDSPQFRSLVEQGLSTQKAPDNKLLVRTIAPRTQPEFLAQGALLDRTTSLGYTNAENVHSLESAQQEISRVIQDGLVGDENETLVDDMLIDVFSNTLLPSLAEILKNEEPLERGMTTPVSVFA